MPHIKASRIRPPDRDTALPSQGKNERGTEAPHRKALKFLQPQDRLVPSSAKAMRDGYPGRLGATVHSDGINFAVHAPHARDIFLVLFDDPDSQATDTIRLPGRTGHVHHGFVEGLGEGALYGFRARGEWNPSQGLRFNENKLLIDPYARAFSGRFRHDGNLLLPYDPHSPDKDFSFDDRDNATAVPKCIAYAKAFDWEEDAFPRLQISDLILYEVHLKGFTADPASGVQNPGTYSGFIEKIPWLKQLGVNAVELLPIYAKLPAEHEGENGKGNYWGYNTFGFFAPEPTYGSAREPGCEVAELKSLIKALHKEGIEVILDVVYNHTAEGNEMGPLLCFKSLDNPGYYALTGADETESARYYHNHSGCGNTFDFGSPIVVRLALDSLRYWVEEFHVDGFRFDLATVHGRGFWGGFEARAPFFQALAQDPVLSQAKMIAEPWDCDCFEQGKFPVGWAEWNAKFRDCARKFIKGDAGQLNELRWRLSGSADLFAANGRGPDAGINFITCHDGFTLNDLISYNEKHNQANGEDNRDGYNDNQSWNCGVEGETDDPAVQALRRRQARNFMCLLLFSQGVPMLSHGDEMLRTQQGNNNAYCQDNPLAWVDWGRLETHPGMVEFTRRAIALRKRIPLLMGRRFLHGNNDTADIPNIAWFGPDGKDLDWNDSEGRSLAFLIEGVSKAPEAAKAPETSEVAEASGGGRRMRRLYFIFHMAPEDREFALPSLPEGRGWRRLADTSLADGEDFLPFDNVVQANGLEQPGLYRVCARSTVILLD